MPKVREPVLSVSGLACRIRGFDVFSDVTFELESGQVAFLVGPNGSGKSTLLRCLTGRVVPSAGLIELNGVPFDSSDQSQRAQIAFVPDVPVFYDDLTADEHLRFIRQANRITPDADRSDEWMRVFDLVRFRDAYPSAYSRGMRQKLACVIALASRPALLLMDEPYGPLDRCAARLLSEQIEQARDEGAAVIVSLHQEAPLLRSDMVLHLSEDSFRAESGGNAV